MGSFSLQEKWKVMTIILEGYGGLNNVNSCVATILIMSEKRVLLGCITMVIKTVTPTILLNNDG